LEAKQLNNKVSVNGGRKKERKERKKAKARLFQSEKQTKIYTPLSLSPPLSAQTKGISSSLELSFLYMHTCFSFSFSFRSRKEHSLVA
jgi:hypothetical protein